MDGMLDSNTIVFSTDSRDLLNIANEAKEAEYLSGYVDWLTIAYEKARHENKTEKYTKRIRYVTFVTMISFMVSISAETERRFEQAHEFEHPKFTSEPSEFRAYLNLISMPTAETEQRFERACFSTQIFERAERVSSKISLGLSTSFN